MPGLGRKTFAAGSVLSASDVQSYLQDQAVMVFATSAARTTAIATAYEGMVTYLKDVERIEVWNGSVWLPMPYAQAVGTASATTGALAINTQTSVNVTFPSGRFAVAPILSAWTSGGRYICFPSTVAAGSASIGIRNVSDATGGDEVVYYSATQMSFGTAAG